MPKNKTLIVWNWAREWNQSPQFSEQLIDETRSVREVTLDLQNSDSSSSGSIINGNDCFYSIARYKFSENVAKSVSKSIQWQPMRFQYINSYMYVWNCYYYCRVYATTDYYRVGSAHHALNGAWANKIVYFLVLIPQRGTQHRLPFECMHTHILWHCSIRINH